MDDNISYPDVVGYCLSDAINMLNGYGIEISSIKTTAPPRHAGRTYNDTFRVLKVFNVDSKKVELLLCDPMLNY